MLTLDERYVELTASLAVSLGVPGATPEAVQAFKDKAKLRALTGDRPYAVGAGVAHSLPDAELVCARLGYPVVVKPRGLGGSIGVVKVSSLAELQSAFALARGAKVGGLGSAYGGVLIEEFIEGPEVSVDSSIRNGKTTIHFVADKLLGPEPYFEETGHIVPTSHTVQLEAIGEAVRDIHELGGFDNGLSHIEFRLSPHGPRLIEANARLGGDLIPYLGLLATGVDLAEIGARIACGQNPPMPLSRPGAAAVRFLYPEAPMKLSKIAWGDAICDGVHTEARQLVPGGTWVAPPPHAFLSRPGLVLGRGADRSNVAATVAKVAESTRLICAKDDVHD